MKQAKSFVTRVITHGHAGQVAQMWHNMVSQLNTLCCTAASVPDVPASIAFNTDAKTFATVVNSHFGFFSAASATASASQQKVSKVLLSLSVEYCWHFIVIVFGQEEQTKKKKKTIA